MQLFGLGVNSSLGVTLLSGSLLGTALLGPASPKQMATPSDKRAFALQTQPEVLNFDALADQGKALLEQAREGSGSAGITLAHYKDHYTMLTARTKSGGGELHGHYADFLFVIAGEGTEMTGGTMLNPKELQDGEVRGTGLAGATTHILRKGDVIHIPAGTPHQAIEAPGQSITIFVIKVHEQEDPATQETAK